MLTEMALPGFHLVPKAGAALLAAMLLTGCATIAEDRRAATVIEDCDDGCPQMVAIPAGSFMMGAQGGEEGRPEGPVHQVTIARPFALARFETTNAEYARFLRESGRMPSKGCWSFGFTQRTFQLNAAADYTAPGDGAGDGAAQMPVTCVSWHDAQAYARWMSDRTGHAYRLPTEAEWEYAARAGSRTAFPWGDDIEAGCIHANIYDAEGAPIGFSGFVPGGGNGLGALDHAACSDGHRGAAPVGSYAANAFGLHDMIGNAWEWTQDCYVAPYPADVPVDGRAYQAKGACERRSVRGGSWITSPFRIRPAWRGRDPEDQLSWIFGFRLARDLEPGEMR